MPRQLSYSTLLIGATAITVDGTSVGATASLNVNDQTELYYITGSATLGGNLTISSTGTAKKGMEFYFRYTASLTPSGNTLTIFGVGVPAGFYSKPMDIKASYNGSSWDVKYSPDFATNGVVTADQISDGTIVEADIANLAVTAAKIANTTITAAKIANNTITAAQIAALTITNAEINDVNGSKIAASSIPNSALATPPQNIQYVKGVIPSSSVLTLNSTPVTVLPQSIVGTTQVILGAFFSLPSGTAYTTNTNLQLRPIDEVGITELISHELDMLGNLTGSGYKQIPVATSSGVGIQASSNGKGFEVLVETGNPAAGTGDLYYLITYVIIPA